MARFQGLQVNQTEQWVRDYTKETVQEVYSHSSGWHTWNDVIRWLDIGAEAQDELNPGQVAGMREDFQELAKQGEPYTADPAKAFDLAHKNRSRTQQGSPGRNI